MIVVNIQKKARGLEPNMPFRSRLYLTHFRVIGHFYGILEIITSRNIFSKMAIVYLHALPETRQKHLDKDFEWRDFIYAF